MMPEISLNILDVVQNSIRANAKKVEIMVSVKNDSDTLSVIIKDDGCGMSEEQLKRVTDPFFTTRTTRKVGLGISFYKFAAESTGGSFSIESKLQKGTVVTAVFGLSHIDRMPLGDINFTIYTLITLNPDIDFYYIYEVDLRKFVLDTCEFRELLGDVPLNSPEVSAYIRDYLNENKLETDNGMIF